MAIISFAPNNVNRSPETNYLPLHTTASGGCVPYHSAIGRIFHGNRHFMFAQGTFHRPETYFIAPHRGAPPPDSSLSTDIFPALRV